MPNRRRRRLSTAMSAVAALAVSSPFAVVAVSDLTDAPQHDQFVQAAVVTDLPNELMSALSQGLSQFGINLPPVPTGLGGASTGGYPGMSPGLTSPGLTSPGLTSPGATPGLTSPGLTSPAATPGLTDPSLATPGATPGLTSPGLTDPGLTDPGLTNPAGTLPGATTPGLTSPAGMTGATTPGLTSPTGLPGATTPGLTDPSLGGGGLGLTGPNEVPITTPVGLDPGMGGTYPILGDPSMGGMPATGGASGGLVSDVMSAANQLGAGQAIDLLKGMVMPAISQAAQGAGGAAAAPAAAAGDAAAAAPLP
ncbi:hypothetical protein E2F47_16735 [Mycobacterium eburneum]|nr:hypothetical protein [Mycobacterium eburneum]TDH51007.1 hypothetical protein E2F47_16735 [Mycobacterium eburneum]